MTDRRQVGWRSWNDSDDNWLQEQPTAAPQRGDVFSSPQPAPIMVAHPAPRPEPTNPSRAAVQRPAWWIAVGLVGIALFVLTFLIGTKLTTQEPAVTQQVEIPAPAGDIDQGGAYLPQPEHQPYPGIVN